jgi:hypothetical protein
MASKALNNIVDSLMYACYAHNRSMNPEVKPEEWQTCFDAPIGPMEERYQDEMRQKMQDWLKRACNRFYVFDVSGPTAANKSFERQREDDAVAGRTY